MLSDSTSHMKRLAAVVVTVLFAGIARAEEPATASADPGLVLMRLRDLDPAIRASAVAEAAALTPPDLALAAALVAMAENPKESAGLRMKAACAAGLQNTFYSGEAVRQALRMAMESGVPEENRTELLNAVIRQGNSIVPEVENAYLRGGLTHNFFESAMRSINTPDAEAARNRQMSGQGKFGTRRSGIDRHTVKDR